MCSPINFVIDWVQNYEHLNDESFPFCEPMPLFSVNLKLVYKMCETSGAGYELVLGGRMSWYPLLHWAGPYQG